MKLTIFPRCSGLVHQGLREIVIGQARKLIDASCSVVVLDALVEKRVAKAG